MIKLALIVVQKASDLAMSMVWWGRPPKKEQQQEQNIQAGSRKGKSRLRGSSATD